MSDVSAGGKVAPKCRSIAPDPWLELPRETFPHRRFARGSTTDSVELPGSWDALQLVLATVFENNSRPRDKVLDCA
jgi:hypothetical protein